MSNNHGTGYKTALGMNIIIASALIGGTLAWGFLSTPSLASEFENRKLMQQTILQNIGHKLQECTALNQRCYQVNGEPTTVVSCNKTEDDQFHINAGTENETAKRFAGLNFYKYNPDADALGMRLPPPACSFSSYTPEHPYGERVDSEGYRWGLNAR